MMMISAMKKNCLEEIQFKLERSGKVSLGTKKTKYFEQ